MNTTLRKIPDDVWKKFKVLCVKQNTSANKQAIQLIENWVEWAEKTEFVWNASSLSEEDKLRFKSSVHAGSKIRRTPNEQA